MKIAKLLVKQLKSNNFGGSLITRQVTCCIMLLPGASRVIAVDHVLRFHSLPMLKQVDDATILGSMCRNRLIIFPGIRGKSPD